MNVFPLVILAGIASAEEPRPVVQELGEWTGKCVSDQAATKIIAQMGTGIRIIGRGVSLNGAPIEIWASAATANFTVIAKVAPGVACFAAGGRDFLSR